MQPCCSPPSIPMASKSPIMETAKNICALTESKQQRSGCPLKFSIAKIMEPDERIERNRSPIDEDNSSSDVDVSTTTYDSAFKKYIPTAHSVHQFVSSRQELMSQYPLLYYPGQLMCAAAQYAALTQHPSAASLLSSTNPTNPLHLSTVNSMNHLQNQSIRRSIATTEKAQSPVKASIVTKNSILPSPTSRDSSASTKQKTFACQECGKWLMANYFYVETIDGLDFSKLIIKCPQLIILNKFRFRQSFQRSLQFDATHAGAYRSVFVIISINVFESICHYFSLVRTLTFSSTFVYR